ncbi:MAG: preprotein translocase subunit YajC [Psychroflexus sp.]|jgi:preprotein translocase subunit YajC|nr:preprotein translocase subunit YajC [Psychroflexus sp.]
MGNIQQFLPFILIFVVLYFFMIRPQMKKQKKEKQFANDLKRGDKVVTKSGLHAKITDFSEKLNAVILDTGAGKMTFDKSSLSMELTESLYKDKDTKKDTKKDTTPAKKEEKK